MNPCAKGASIIKNIYMHYKIKSNIGHSFLCERKGTIAEKGPVYGGFGGWGERKDAPLFPTGKEGAGRNLTMHLHAELLILLDVYGTLYLDQGPTLGTVVRDST